MQGYERPDSIEHLMIHALPFHLGVRKIVQRIRVADLLSVIDEGHTVEGELHDGQAITVFAIELPQCVPAVVIVLVVVREIDHPAVLHLRRLLEESQPDLFQTVGIEAPSAQACDGTLQTPGVIVVEATGVDA